MTDGGLYYGAEGQEMLRFNVLDGLGLQKLMIAGLTVVIVSQSESPIITSRARKLGISHCLTGIDCKRAPIKALADRAGLSLAEVAHIADDENDLSLLRSVGVAVTVPNGLAKVQAVARFVTRAHGGNGAVRELAEAILSSRVHFGADPGHSCP
ncbi:HAD hydrolase family protein [Rhodobacteraceae bacterium ASV31]|nr:HAD hydrolase family protein [Anianabacter salinae]